MSFDWQPLDQAAQTLGVDADTLQQWINEGRAPTRTGAGGVEVLIEFPDEGDSDSGDDDVIDVQDVSPGAQPLQVVPRHEMQLAGAMAAAWQRMAEHSEAELTRTRRIGTVGYIALALLAIAAGVGIWYATAETTRARGEARSTAAELQQKINALDIAEKDKADLRTRVDALQAELTEAKTELATATERATQLAAAAEQAKQQHEKYVESLNSQLADLRKQIDRAAADLKQARADIGKVEKAKSEVEAENKKLAEQLEKLKTQIKELTDAPAPGVNLFEETDP